MGIFINGVGLISPGYTQENELIRVEDDRLFCAEPDYSKFIDVKAIRRMSRIIKMGVTSSMLSLKGSGIDKPDAIIVGTALGCLEDTVSFLNKLVLNKEELLNPTAFIHSTHNTISSQIALNLKCMGYNSTYVHRNLSFESALIDAMLLFDESAIGTALVGGIDELCSESYQILKRLGYYKGTDSQSVIQAGEGSAFFNLSNESSPGSLAEIKAVECVSFAGLDAVEERARKLLQLFNVDSPDLILSGNVNRDNDSSLLMDLYSNFTSSERVCEFKRFCGEYPTASSFAVHLGADILAKQSIPKEAGIYLQSETKLKNILIHNNYKNVHHSLILLSAC